ncbi:MAG: DUF1015 domain-containing protein [Clostridia bacterium]|nr:DUF1015 domain-containing protein [Clostridia bacterium]
MAIFRPFKAIRPVAGKAQDVAALPYDVMNSEEAKKMVEGKPYSFLHVDKAEIDFDPIPENIYTEAVYLKARENLDKLVTDGICQQDEKPCIYIYRQIMNGRSQTGLVGCTAIDDYINNIIKRHELTRADKEADRINHVDYCDANTGPIFLAYRADGYINSAVEGWKEKHAPVYDFVTEDGVANTVWVVDDSELIDEISRKFADTDYLYIADGHHRAASAVKVGLKRREQNPDFTGEEEFNFFLSVLFPENELEIMDYNRVIKDLNGYTSDEFIAKVKNSFTVEAVGKDAYKPQEKHTFGMLLDGEWYKLGAKEGTFDKNDPVERLDVSILQNNLISPILGIDDPRTDKRIDFIGGIRGLGELERRVNTDMKIAFSMYPTTLDDLMAIADADKIMPPKSTWFEPKLLSGLFIHKLS